MPNILYISSSYPLSIDDNLTLIRPIDNVFTFLYQNFSSSYVVAPETSTQHMYVDSLTNFPSQAYLSIDNEILYYSSASITGSSNNLYILHIPGSDARGLFSTSLAEHTSQSRAELRIISEYHNRHSNAIINIENTLGYYIKGYPTGLNMTSEEQNEMKYNGLSGSNSIYSGNIEQRLRFLEWAVIEIALSGSGIRGPIVHNDYTGSYDLLYKIMGGAL